MVVLFPYLQEACQLGHVKVEVCNQAQKLEHEEGYHLQHTTICQFVDLEHIEVVPAMNLINANILLIL
jgi:hypothetical protein